MGSGDSISRMLHLPWHSFDFDFASLNVSLRFWKQPEGKLTLGIGDIVRADDGLQFGFKGRVELVYEEDAERHGLLCRRYSINGPGLEFRGGTVWVRRGDDPIVVDYEIELPDEPGMTSSKLRYQREENLDLSEWEAFILSRVD